MGNLVALDASSSLLRCAARVHDEAGVEQARKVLQSISSPDQVWILRNSVQDSLESNSDDKAQSSEPGCSNTWTYADICFLLTLSDLELVAKAFQRERRTQASRRISVSQPSLPVSPSSTANPLNVPNDVTKNASEKQAEEWHAADLKIAITGSDSVILKNLLIRLLENYSECPGEDKRLDQKPTASFLLLRETPCLAESTAFLLEQLPSCFFSYKGTTQGLTDAAPFDPMNESTFETSDESSASTSKSKEEAPASPLYPFLLVNMKAGVSFHKVLSRESSVRVGGSPIGPATFFGLLDLLSGEARSPVEAFEYAHQGDAGKVDMLVSDIYGGDYPAVGLKGSLIASTLGKMQRLPRPLSTVTRVEVPDTLQSNAEECVPELTTSNEAGPEEVEEPDPQDVAKSLLMMTSFNSAQLAYFNAVIHSCKR